jgi:branched-chain amino acid transport system ATP-binding protein
MLSVEAIHTYYEKSHILHGVSLEVHPGEIVTLLGRNGAGKTTTLKSIVGTAPPADGAISFEGTSLVGLKPHEIVQRGVGFVPEHRGIFATLTVEENLRISHRRGSSWRLDDVYELFPRLAERRSNAGTHLSGGEQQMLAIARALLIGPRLLLLDEPTEGLAPVIVSEIVETVRRIREERIPILLVEQNIKVCERVADRHYVLEQGRVVYSGTREEFAKAESVKDRYLGLKAT